MMFAKVINECNCAKSIMRYAINNINNTNELKKQMHLCCKDEVVSAFEMFINGYINRHIGQLYCDEELRRMIRDFESIDKIINYFNLKLEHINNLHNYKSSVLINTMITNSMMYGNVDVFKFMITNGYFKSMGLYNIPLGFCKNVEIFKIINDYGIQIKNITKDIMYLFCNHLTVDIDKTFSIVVDMKWIKLFISYFESNIIMFPNIVCYAIQNNILGKSYKYIHFVKDIVFNNYSNMEECHEKFYNNSRKQIIDAIVNNIETNTLRKKLYNMFMHNIESCILCEKQLYPLITLYKLIEKELIKPPNRKIQKILQLKYISYRDIRLYNKLIILMVLSNNYNILHKMIEISNINDIIKFTYECSKNVTNYNIYYGDTTYNFKEINIKYLEYIKNHFI